MADIRVAAGRKIAIISHCLLNQNVKPHQRARYPGIVNPVLDAIQEEGYALVQLPCPEIAFAGTRRWSQVIEQYDTPKYRHHCRDLASQSIDQIDHFLRDNTFTLVLIGLEGSPSCGVQLTGSSSEWQGYPGAVEMNGKYPVKKGTGLFMQALQREIESRGLIVPPMLAVGLDLYGIDLDQIGPRLRTELKELFA
jgi:predicted secreted protein